MRIDVIPANRLSEAHREQWKLLQQSNPDLQSPFFCPEFILDVAAVRDDVEVAVLAADEQPVGFFPFQRGPGGRGTSVGGILSDFQGVIAAPGLVVDPLRLIHDCGLSSWQFHRLLASQQAFRPYHWDAGDSVFLDLRGGFEAYRQGRREAGSTMLSRIKDKSRKANREVGPVRFVAHSDEPHVLRSLMEWKSRQYQRIRSENYLTKPWTLAPHRPSPGVPRRGVWWSSVLGLSGRSPGCGPSGDALPVGSSMRGFRPTRRTSASTRPA